MWQAFGWGASGTRYCVQLGCRASTRRCRRNVGAVSLRSRFSPRIRPAHNAVIILPRSRDTDHSRRITYPAPWLRALLLCSAAKLPGWAARLLSSGHDPVTIGLPGSRGQGTILSDEVAPGGAGELPERDLSPNGKALSPLLSRIVRGHGTVQLLHAGFRDCASGARHNWTDREFRIEGTVWGATQIGNNRRKVARRDRGAG